MYGMYGAYAWNVCIKYVFEHHIHFCATNTFAPQLHTFFAPQALYPGVHRAVRVLFFKTVRRDSCPEKELLIKKNKTLLKHIYLVSKYHVLIVKYI